MSTLPRIKAVAKYTLIEDLQQDVAPVPINKGTKSDMEIAKARIRVGGLWSPATAPDLVIGDGEK